MCYLTLGNKNIRREHDGQDPESGTPGFAQNWALPHLSFYSTWKLVIAPRPPPPYLGVVMNDTAGDDKKNK